MMQTASKLRRITSRKSSKQLSPDFGVSTRSHSAVIEQLLHFDLPLRFAQARQTHGSREHHSVVHCEHFVERVVDAGVTAEISKLLKRKITSRHTSEKVKNSLF